MFRWLVRLVAFVRRLLGLGSKSPAPRSNITGPATAPDAEILTNTIRILGTRSSGKTTYLAALLRNPLNEHENSFIKRIAPIGTGAEKLIDQAFNILQGRAYFDPTPLATQATTVEEIGFRIEIYLPRRKLEETVTLSIFTKDYSGEFFEDLRLHANDIVEDYLTDCAESQGLMLLVDGTNVGEDGHLEMNLPTFLRRLDQSVGGQGWQGRIAFVVSKCEQPKLYLKRQSVGEPDPRGGP